MKVLIINSVCGIKSTGRIVADIATSFLEKGHDVCIAFGREQVPEEYKELSRRIGSEIGVRLNTLETRIFDNDGFTARKSTSQFLEWANEYNPDLLWLHNLHGYYINIEELFNWIKDRPRMEVRWTLHDCWAFTGHCSYFTYARCNKWEKHCKDCPQKREYPASFLFDRCAENYDKKRKIFTGVSNMKLITPSEWLANLTRKSFLSEYLVEVQYNTINKNVFKKTDSNIKQVLGIEDKKMILGVAAQWQPSKGYEDFFEIRKKLSEEYIVILVGVTEAQASELPSGIIGIKRTNNTQELAKLYTAADVFINPTHEDNYPTVNLESIACGTPVITYNVGGSPESARENGYIVEEGDINGIVSIVAKICRNEVIKDV